MWTTTPIQALNRKGYKTVNCCAGHPFGNYDEILSGVKYTLEDCPILNVVAIEENKTANHPDCPYRLLTQSNELNREIYISFEKGTVFPNMLEGFYIDEDDYIVKGSILDENGNDIEAPLDVVTMKAYYDEGIPVYDFLLENLRDLRDLYEWALSLPDKSEYTQSCAEAT